MTTVYLFIIVKTKCRNLKNVVYQEDR